MTSLSSPINFTWVLSSCITCLSLLRGSMFSFLHIDSGITLEDALESTKQLWRFLLKTSTVKRNNGMKGSPFLSSKKAFTVGLFLRYARARFSPWSVIVIRVYVDFKACNKNSFCWGIIHMSMTNIFAFNFFKSSTML
jgi:hypothetical protein